MDTNKRQKYKEAAGFFVFVIIIVFLFSKVTWLFRGNAEEAREAVQGFKNEKCDIDIILFDGSDLLRFYDPLEAWNKYGFTSYNYATPSAQGDMLRFYAEESRKTMKADLYVFDLRTIEYVSDVGTEQSIRNWSDSLSVYSPLRAMGVYSYLFNRDRTGIDVPSYFIDIINYHTNYDSLASEYQWSYMDLNNIKKTDKGFRPYYNHTPFDRPVDTEERAELTGYQTKALEDLVDYCNKEKLNALFICSPFAIRENTQKVMNSISDYIEDNGYEFVDFNKYFDEIGIDFETDFRDRNHVNYFGAKKFTDYLSRFLKEKYDPEDHRSDSRFASWNEDYEEMARARDAWARALQSELDIHFKAKEIGLQLKSIEDFREWYDCIRNDNYSVVVRIGKMPEGLSEKNPFYKMLTDYGVDYNGETYVGVWSGTEVLYGSGNAPETESELGVDAGRGTDTCKIDVDSCINIAGKDYVADESPIQIVVYNNIYKEVIDNVNIAVDSADSVKTVRP